MSGAGPCFRQQRQQPWASSFERASIQIIYLIFFFPTNVHVLWSFDSLIMKQLIFLIFFLFIINLFFLFSGLLQIPYFSLLHNFYALSIFSLFFFFKIQYLFQSTQGSRFSILKSVFKKMPTPA